MGTCGGFGQIAHAKVSLQLHSRQVGNRAGHGDSSVKRTGWGSSSRPRAHLSEAAGLTRRSPSRRPTPGREASKSPCQQHSHEYQASVPGYRTANEIAGPAGLTESQITGIATGPSTDWSSGAAPTPSQGGSPKGNGWCKDVAVRLRSPGAAWRGFS